MTRDSNEEVLQCFRDVLRELAEAYAYGDIDDVRQCEHDLAVIALELTRRGIPIPSENKNT